MKNKLNCIFCDKDLSKEIFREDYILVAVRDDPEEPDSMNKVAKPVHQKCLDRFIQLNFAPKGENE